MVQKREPYPKRASADRPLYEHVGRRIRERRIELAMSQEQVGERLAVHPSEIHRWEKAERYPSAARLHDLAVNLTVSLDYFFSTEEAPAKPNPHQQMALGVTRNFVRIAEENISQATSHLVRVIAEMSDQAKRLREEAARLRTENARLSKRAKSGEP